ncbi:MAG: hypothetical protein NTV63_04175 [Candidatus Woesearchaeota archaeon]|nr:hypothetical protein [Candidatus Woesearchaeota archaeon]
MGDVEELKFSLKSTFAKVKEDIDNSNKKIELLEKQNKLLLKEIKKLTSALEKKNEEPLKKEILQKFNRNKRNLVKGKIMDLIGSSRNISIPELKEIAVDQMRYCSKATFYRYIDELKKNSLLESAKINNREIIVLSRQI